MACHTYERMNSPISTACKDILITSEMDGFQDTFHEETDCCWPAAESGPNGVRLYSFLHQLQKDSQISKSELRQHQMQLMRSRPSVGLGTSPLPAAYRPRLKLAVHAAVGHIAESWILIGSAAVSLSVPTVISRLRGSK